MKRMGEEVYEERKKKGLCQVGGRGNEREKTNGLKEFKSSRRNNWIQGIQS
jgi:hypothetical protein